MAMVGLDFPTFWRLQVSSGRVGAMGSMKPDMIWTAMRQLDFPIF